MLNKSLIKKEDLFKEMDNAKFGWFHVKACLVSGIGFFTDAYDLFIIQFAVVMIGYVYFPTATDSHKANHMPKSLETFLKQSALIGTLVGQLVFGYLADRVGRKKMYGVELIMIVLFTVTQSFAADTPSGMSVVHMLIIWRFIMGIGIGGDYPLSAIITAEFANSKNRGAMIAAVFAMQGFGILTGSIVSLIVLWSLQSLISDPSTQAKGLDMAWRIIVGLGAIPGLVAIYFRLTIPETPRFQHEKKLEKEGKEEPQIKGSVQMEVARRPNVMRYLRRWGNLKILIGTSLSWFALDVGFYGTNLNQSLILSEMGYADSSLPTYDLLIQLVQGNLLIAFLGTVPGYWLTVAFVDKWGRIPIQLMGFVALTVLFLVMGLCKEQLPSMLFISLYTMANLFNNFGPNATTFIIPGEVFPTKYRSTCHGISAASGKFGAIVSQLWFLGIGQDHFVAIMMIFSVFMGIGLLATFLIPETKGRSLEDISDGQELGSSKIELYD